MHIRAAIVNGHSNFFCGFGEQITQLETDRFGKRNVRDDSFPEKSMHRAQAGAVVELRWQQNVAWFVFFLQTADRCDGNDPSNIESTQGINVRAVIQFVGKNSVAPSMSRQKVDLPSVHGTA